MTTDKDKEAAEKREKEAADKRERDKRDAVIANRDQDPNHPANKTLSPERKAVPRSEAEAFNVPPGDLMTEQEKLAAGAAGDETAGVGPVSPSVTTTGPVETIEDQGIGPRTPYPTGNPPLDSETTTRSQGIHRGDQPATRDTPDKTKVKV